MSIACILPQEISKAFFEPEAKLPNHSRWRDACDLTAAILRQSQNHAVGCGLYFWVKSVFRFRLRSDCRRFGRLQSGASGFSLNRFRGVFRRPANGGRPGASSRGHHGRQGTGRGVPPSGCRAGRRQTPTLCSPSNAGLKTGAGPTSSIAGLAALQPLDSKI